jgi:hypothetical protein
MIVDAINESFRSMSDFNLVFFNFMPKYFPERLITVLWMEIAVKHDHLT